MFGKTIFFLLGALSTYSVSVYALSFSEEMAIVEEQATLKEFTGQFQTDLKNPDLQVHTYEAPCRGFVIIEETPTQTIHMGYGDLSAEYTYTIDKPVYETKASTTPTDTLPIDIVPIDDTPIDLSGGLN